MLDDTSRIGIALSFLPYPPRKRCSKDCFSILLITRDYEFHHSVGAFVRKTIFRGAKQRVRRHTYRLYCTYATNIDLHFSRLFTSSKST